MIRFEFKLEYLYADSIRWAQRMGARQLLPNSWSREARSRFIIEVQDDEVRRVLDELNGNLFVSHVQIKAATGELQ